MRRTGRKDSIKASIPYLLYFAPNPTALLLKVWLLFSFQRNAKISDIETVSSPWEIFLAAELNFKVPFSH